MQISKSKNISTTADSTVLLQNMALYINISKSSGSYL